MQRIYLDHASTTPLLPEVIEEMNAVMSQTYGNASSIHHHGRSARTIIEANRKKIANALRASIGEIFFTSSATEAHNMILYGAVRDLGVTRIISSPTEHHCILHPLDHLSDGGSVKVDYVKVDSSGQVDVNHLKDLLQQEGYKTLVSLMHANNEIGTMIDLAAIGDLCHEHGALLHCDTVQTIGKYPIDVSATPISFCAGSAHKFNGPKGIGFVYINGDNIIKPYLRGGAQERNMRAGTENVYGIAGMGKALEMALLEQEERKNYVSGLRQYFVDRLDAELIDIKINGGEATQSLYNIVSVSFPASEKADLLHFNLDIGGISASAGSACSSGIEADSHVLLAIGHPPERKTIRFSLSHLNTTAELDIVVDKLKNITPPA
jgi:cysteine desulfurase